MSKKGLDSDWANHIKHKRLIAKIGGVTGASQIGFKNTRAFNGGVYSSGMGKSGSLNDMSPEEQ